MTRLEPAWRLTIYLGHADQHHHHSLAADIVRRARDAGLAGATVLQGIAGYGHSGRVHVTPTWHLVDQSPIAVYIVDRPDKIRAFLPQLDDVQGRCLIVYDEVDLVVGDPPG